MNTWAEHVTNFAKENNLPLGKAMKNKTCRNQWKKMKSAKTGGALARPSLNMPIVGGGGGGMPVPVPPPVAVHGSSNRSVPGNYLNSKKETGGNRRKSKKSNKSKKSGKSRKTRK